MMVTSPTTSERVSQCGRRAVHIDHVTHSKSRIVNCFDTGVTKAVSNVNDIIAPELIKAGVDVTNQKAIDDFLLKLDGTSNKTKLGANAILAVSIAAAYAGAAAKGVPLYAHIAELAGVKAPYYLPAPAMNVINGGSHAGNKLAFQEFMIVPTGAQTFTEAMKVGSEVYHTLKSVIKSKYGIDSTNVGDEGGFAPPFASADEALEVLTEAINKAGYEGKVHISLDVASSEFYEDGKYNLDFKNPNAKDSDKITGKVSVVFSFVVLKLLRPCSHFTDAPVRLNTL